jgi:hypothetical protein
MAPPRDFDLSGLIEIFFNGHEIGSCISHFHNLQLQKCPSRVFGQNSGNSADISKAFFEMGISKFDSSQVGVAVSFASDWYKPPDAPSVGCNS